MRMTLEARWVASLALLLACRDDDQLPNPAASDSLGEPCEQSADCSDELSCNGDELCREGRCVAGDAPRCDDQLPCTLDGCTEGQGCVHLPMRDSACAVDSGGARDGATDEQPGLSDDAGAPLVPPSDEARAPDVDCPTSVDFVSANTKEQLELYRGIHCVAGPVYLGAALTDLSPLSSVRRIGSLQYTGSSSSLAGLAALVRVDGNLDLSQGADDGAGLDFPALRWVGGDLRIGRTLASKRAFAALRYVGGTFALTGKAIPAEEPFAALVMLGGSLTLNASVPIALGALTVVQGDLTLSDSPVLASLQNLRTVGGRVVAVNTSLVSLSLPRLANVTGRLEIVGNANLVALDLPALDHVRDLEIRLNPRLSRCTVDALHERAGRDLAAEPLLCCNLGCEVCEEELCRHPGVPTSGQSTAIEGDIAGQTGFPLEVFSTVESIGSFEIVYGETKPLPAFALREVGTLYVTGYATSLSGLSALRSVDQLSVYGNPNLTSLKGLEGVERLGSLLIQENHALTDLSALDPRVASLRELNGTVTVRYNLALSQCDANDFAAALDELTEDKVITSNNRACQTEDAGAASP
jgi:hypothetical protein